jgi:uncharacterized protein
LFEKLRAPNFACIECGQIKQRNLVSQLLNPHATRLKNRYDFPSMQIIRKSAFTVTPWKNGGGVTHEAMRVPAGGDPFLWRVSIARIDKSGPFSDFAAYNRTMVLLQGDGLELRCSNGERYSLRHVGELAEFDGAVPTQCELKNGACVDLNLITAKSLHGVHARVHRLQEPLPLTAAARGRSTLIVSIDAPVVLRAGGGDAAMLEPWDLAVLSDPSGNADSLAARHPSAATLVFLATVPDA